MRILALIKPSLRLCNNTAADLGQLHGVWQVGQISWGSLLMCGQGASQLDLMKTGLGARSLGRKGAFGMRDRQVGLKNLSCTHMCTQTHTHRILLCFPPLSTSPSSLHTCSTVFSAGFLLARVFSLLTPPCRGSPLDAQSPNPQDSLVSVFTLTDCLFPC